MAGDARNRLISKQRASMGDARDRLAMMAKQTDARDKLKKIRNLKQGKVRGCNAWNAFATCSNNSIPFQFEVKKRGNITLTTTTKGDLVLTTKKKEAAVAAASRSKSGAASAAGRTKTAAGVRIAARAAALAASATSRATRRAGAAATTVTKSGSLTKRVGRGGSLAITTKKTGTALKAVPKSPATAAAARGATRKPGRGAGPSAAVPRGRKEQQQQRGSGKPLTRTIKGELSESARLDEELLNTTVDPLVLKRTVKNSVRRNQSPPGRKYVPTRTLSPDPYYVSLFL